MTAVEQACAEILAKQKKAEYQREWRRKNPGKQREYTARYWAKKGQEELSRLVSQMDGGTT